MNRLIDADALINAVEKESQIDGAYGYMDTKSIIDVIDDAPTIEPERNTGKWIQDGHHIQCNQCGISICDKDREGDVLPKKFCPNCGADMRGDDRNEI